MCFLNDAGCNDDDFVDFKRRCGEKLSVLNNNESLPKQNIAAFGLDSCNLSLYHQCVRAAADERENVPSEYKRVVEDWRRMVLGLDDEDETVGDIYGVFCKIAGFISYPKLATDEMMADFVCPLCILTDAYTDIGWTDYVCPRPAGEASSVVSKRGVDKNLPMGACEHLMTVRTTRYDRLFE